MKRCQHLGQSCIHRYQQATRFDELPPFSWREMWLEVVVGTIVLSAMFIVAVFYFAAIAVQI